MPLNACNAWGGLRFAHEGACQGIVHEALDRSIATASSYFSQGAAPGQPENGGCRSVLRAALYDVAVGAWELRQSAVPGYMCSDSASCRPGRRQNVH